MDPATSAAIKSVWRSMRFPNPPTFSETVGRLIALGVQRYLIDYVALTATAYVGDTVDVEPIVPYAASRGPWDQETIVKTIRRIQAGEIVYEEFAGGIIEAGVTNYWACLEGKRVVYMGAMGNLHVEWFPGVKPAE